MNRSASPLNAPAEMPPGTPGSKPTLLNLTIHAELIQLLFAARDLAEAVAEGRADVGIFVAPGVDARLATRHYSSGTLAAIVPSQS